VRALLAQGDVGFVIVSSASPRSVDEALYFHERLHAESMPIAGMIANRVTTELWPACAPLPEEDELAAALALNGMPGLDLAARLARTLSEHEILARADAREVSRLFKPVIGARVVVPRLETDVHDLSGLARLVASM